MLIDTHCHLDEATFAEGADAVIARAKLASVGAFVCIGVGGAENALQALRLAERRPDVTATVGVHPHDASSFDAEAEAMLLPLLEHPRCVAVGEIGLDYHYDHSPREAQDHVFRRFIAEARRLRKPIVVHTRSAPEATLAALREEHAGDVGGIIHCFSEDRAFARHALDLGFDVSFSGIITFKNARAVQEVAAWAPLERILVETDSPYLAPVPLRGKKCEPAYIVHTAAKLAEIRGISRHDVEVATTANAIRRLGPLLAEALTEIQSSK